MIIMLMGIGLNIRKSKINVLVIGVGDEDV